jgi:hypothetical protein
LAPVVTFAFWLLLARMLISWIGIYSDPDRQ